MYRRLSERLYSGDMRSSSATQWYQPEVRVPPGYTKIAHGVCKIEK
jgi:hypothetical protein